LSGRENLDMQFKHHLLDDVPGCIRANLDMKFKHHMLDDVPGCIRANLDMQMKHHMLDDVPACIRANRYMKFKHHLLNDVPACIRVNLDMQMKHHLLDDVPACIRANLDMKFKHHLLNDVPLDFRRPTEPKNLMQILVRTLSGRSLCLTVSPHDAIYKIKLQIHDETSVDTNLQVLKFNSTVLEDEKQLTSYMIAPGDTLSVVAGLAGGAPPLASAAELVSATTGSQRASLKRDHADLSSTSSSSSISAAPIMGSAAPSTGCRAI
jgi:hypothetical protein